MISRANPQGGSSSDASPAPSSRASRPPAKASRDNDSASVALRVAAPAAPDARDDDAMPSTPDQTPAHLSQLVASGVVRVRFAWIAAQCQTPFSAV